MRGISAETHVTYLTAKYQGCSDQPNKYEDIGRRKGFYKLEPIAADGGEVSSTRHTPRGLGEHPQMREIGYHNRDYFLGHGKQFSHQPWATWRTPPTAVARHLDPENGERNGSGYLATGITRRWSAPQRNTRTGDHRHQPSGGSDTFVEQHAGEFLPNRAGAPAGRESQMAGDSIVGGDG